MEICGLRHALALLRDFFSSFTSYSFFALQDFRICQVGIFVDASVQSCLPKAELCLLPIIEFIGTNNPKKRAQQNLFLSFFASGFGLWYPMLTVKEATEYGYYARYEHSPGEPDDTLTGAIMFAVEIASDEARKTGKTHYVTSTPVPKAIYLLRADNPELTMVAMSVMYELTPDWKVIKRTKPTRH
jgi:hypothetical protein